MTPDPDALPDAAERAELERVYALHARPHWPTLDAAIADPLYRRILRLWATHPTPPMIKREPVTRPEPPAQNDAITSPRTIELLDMKRRASGERDDD